MLTILALLLVLWLAARFAYEYDFVQLVDLMGQFVDAHTYLLFGLGVLTALVVPGIVLACESFRFYTLMYYLAKLYFWLSIFLVCLVSLAAVLFRFDLGINLWSLLGVTAVLPFLFAGSAAFSLQLADSYYPIKDSLFHLLLLAGLSLFLVNAVAFL